MLPSEVSQELKTTLNDILSTTYSNIKSHFVEKFGDQGEIFDENIKQDRMFMVCMLNIPENGSFLFNGHCLF